MQIIKATEPEPKPVSDYGKDNDSDDGELSNVPHLEDNWEVDPDSAKTEWVPVSLAVPPLPGYPGPNRYAEWPGRDKNGKRVEPTEE